MPRQPGLSAEAFGVLRALSTLGDIRYFDAVAVELAVSGLAKLAGGRLSITRKGRLFARIAERRLLDMTQRRGASRWPRLDRVTEHRRRAAAN